MGLTSQSHTPLLPAPTDFTNFAASDVGTNISTRSDKTSFSIPDNGSEIHIRKPRGTNNMSPASLLIEYYEGGKSSKSGNTRPSVRVKVRPSSKSGAGTNLNDAIKITKMGRDDQPVLVKRIPLDGTDQNVQLSGRGASPEKDETNDLEAQAVAGSELTRSSGSHLSGRQPLEIEIGKNSSDMSSGYRIQNGSEISSMPAESSLDAPLTFKALQHRRSRSLERNPTTDNNLLKAPVDARSRSLSREREHIAQRVIDKLNAERDSATRRKLQKVRDKGGRDLVEADLKARNRRSTSKSHNDSDLRSPDSSSLRTREADSNVSGISRSSVNNPKVIQAVEDAIRRLILPEIESLKRNQSLNQHRNRDSLASGSSGKTDPSGRASKITEDSLRRKERRRASRTESERSVDTIEREKRRAREYDSKHSTRSRDIAREGLTAEALRTHNTSDAEKESRERRMRRSKPDSRSNSIANTDQEYYDDGHKIPPMPLKSDLMDSELTRESILSAETADSDDARKERPEHAFKSPLHEVSRGNPLTIQPESRLESKTPNPLSPPYSRPSTRLTAIRASSATPTPHKQRVSSSESVRSQLSIKTKAKNAGLAAAGLSGGAALAAAGLSGGAALAALYEHDRGMDTGDRARSRQSNRSGRTVSREELAPRSATIHEETAASPPTTKVESYVDDNEHAFEVAADEAFARAEEDQPIVPEHNLAKERETKDVGQDQDGFYDEQHRLNDEYRHSPDYESLQPSSMLDTVNSGAERSIKDVAANPHIVSDPIGVESAVASLLDPSMVSTEAPSTRRSGGHSRVDSDSPSIRSEDSPVRRTAGLSTQHDNDSRDRWALLRETARSVSIGGSRETSPDKPRTPIQPEVSKVQASPAESTPKPLLYRGASDDSIRQSQPEPITHTQSWPMSSDPQALQQLQDHDHRHFESPDVTPGTQLHHDVSSNSKSKESMQESVLQYDGAKGHEHEGFSQDRAAMPRSPVPVSLEGRGYMSNKQNQPANDYSPLSFSKGPPKLFDDVDLTRPSPDFMLSPGKTMNSAPPAQIRQHDREYSGNSHGVDEPMFQAATGTGINHINSKDIVALMDHLSARDGQRSARDTEILVTLVRSAAEMRDSIEGMKKFIEQQNHINMQRTDMDADKIVTKILSGPRPPPASMSPSKRHTIGGEDVSESPRKKTNIFKRALKGLSGKSPTDLTHIEDMLMQLLEEVEGLRDDRGIPQSTPWPSKSQRPGSLDSYERLRVAPTYQTDFDVHGQPITVTKPNQSQQRGFDSGPVSLGQSQSQSNFDTQRSTEKFYSAREESSEGDRTPTQERPNPLSSHSVQQYIYTAVPPIPTIIVEDNRQKHASAASSFVPVVSRWSKTTESTSHDNRNSLGSEKDVLSHNRYSSTEDDQLPRSPSPLLPQNKLDAISPASHPKYHANRNSLDLEHPQPRQASTGRHQSNLEHQATSFHAPEHSPLLNQSDVFGSHPSLGRLAAQYGVSTTANTAIIAPVTLGRFTNVNIDSSQHTYSSPVNNRDQGPLIPAPIINAAIPVNSTTHGLHPSEYQHLHYATSSPSPQSASNPTTNSVPSSPTSSRHEQIFDRADEAWHDTRLPTPLRVGRYQPGELLNPIEERYSMEGDRSSLYHRDSVKSKRGGHGNRGSVHEVVGGGGGGGGEGSVGSRRASAAGMADVQEEEEGDENLYSEQRAQPQYQQSSRNQEDTTQYQRHDGTQPAQSPSYDDPHAHNRSLTSTPKMSPRPALRATEPGGGGGARKLTGPRDMPGSPGSGGSASPRIAGARLLGARDVNGPLRGTVRRKPVG